MQICRCEIRIHALKVELVVHDLGSITDMCGICRVGRSGLCLSVRKQRLHTDISRTFFIPHQRTDIVGTAQRGQHQRNGHFRHGIGTAEIDIVGVQTASVRVGIILTEIRQKADGTAGIHAVVLDHQILRFG